MAKTVPGTFTAPSLLQLGSGEDIDAEDYNAIAEAENHIWSRCGARVCGLFLNPIFTTTSATYTQTTGSSSRNLSGWTGVVAPRRRVLNSGTYYYALTLAIVGANVDCVAEFYNDPDPGVAPSSDATASVVGSTFAAATGTVLLPVTSDVYMVRIRAKYNAAGTASLALVNIYEAVDPSSYYP